MEYNEPPLLLRGGTGTDLAIRKEEFVNLFADMFDTLLYKELRTPPFSQSIDRTYTDNRTFWNEALSGLHFESMRVRLEGFHLTEWLPSAPGRYFTLDAKASREEARRNHIIPDGSEYDPQGKESMVLGGVGSVRLKSKYISSYNTYFLGASSTGISHQGIPVALRETEYRQVIQEIKENGGCLTNLIGTLQILPAFLSLIHYDRKVPRYCLIIESIEVIRASSPSELLATVAITFSGGLFEWQSPSGANSGAKLWSFCSFFPGPLFLKRNYKSLDEAVDWLESYANKYSRYENASILTDFDEHYQHFNIPVEFPLSQLFSDKINVDLIDFYTKRYSRFAHF